MCLCHTKPQICGHEYKMKHVSTFQISSGCSWCTWTGNHKASVWTDKESSGFMQNVDTQVMWIGVHISTSSDCSSVIILSNRSLQREFKDPAVECVEEPLNNKNSFCENYNFTSLRSNNNCYPYMSENYLPKECTKVSQTLMHSRVAIIHIIVSMKLVIIVLKNKQVKNTAGLSHDMSILCLDKAWTSLLNHTCILSFSMKTIVYIKLNEDFL